MRNLLVVVTLLFAATASANPHYSRKPDLRLDVKLSARVRPTAPVAPPAHPVATADDVMRGQERAEPLRRQQEAILEGLVADTPDTDPDKPDYMFRLAEHYAKQMRFWRLKSVEATLPPPTHVPE